MDSFSDAKDLSEIPLGSPQMGCQIHVGYEKFAAFDK